MTRTSRRTFIASGAALAALPHLARAEPLSDQTAQALRCPSRLAVPADFIARVVTQGMAAQLGQLVVVGKPRRRRRAGSIDAVAKSAPDGHIAIAWAMPPDLSAARYMTDRMPFDPRRDLAYPTMVVRVPRCWWSTKLGLNNVAALVAHAKGNLAGSTTARPVQGVPSFRSPANSSRVEAGSTSCTCPTGSARRSSTCWPVSADAIADITAMLQHIRSGAPSMLAITSAKTSPVCADHGRAP